MLSDLDARSAEAINERLDLPKLRQSIARQVARAFLAKNPDIASKSPLGAQTGVMVLGGFVNAYLAETFTPQAIEAMLAESQAPAALGGEKSALPSLSQMQDGMALLRLSGFDGPTSFRVEGPAGPDG